MARRLTSEQARAMVARRKDRAVPTKQNIDQVAEELVASADPAVSETKRSAVDTRWSKVRETYEAELETFRTLPLDDSLNLLERLRKLTEDASRILNQRIGEDRDRIRCVTCRKDLSQSIGGTRPAWQGKADYHDPKNPAIIRSLYWCSMACHNAYVRKSQGALGTTT